MRLSDTANKALATAPRELTTAEQAASRARGEIDTLVPQSGDMNPWMAGVLAFLLRTWVTFVPCFIFILLGAPYVERLRHNRSLSAALTGITLAVVGVITNLALYFALHTLFRTTTTLDTGPLHLLLPDLTTFRPVEAGIAVIAVVLIFVRRWSMLKVLGTCAVLGMAAALAGLPIG